MYNMTAVEWVFDKMLDIAAGNSSLTTQEILDQAKAMEKEQMEKNMEKAIFFGWELSHYHRHNTEEKLLKMQKDFITSIIEGGEQ